MFLSLILGGARKKIFRRVRQLSISDKLYIVPACTAFGIGVVNSPSSIQYSLDCTDLRGIKNYVNGYEQRYNTDSVNCTIEKNIKFVT